jgi:hypothetical protein
MFLTQSNGAYSRHAIFNNSSDAQNLNCPIITTEDEGSSSNPEGYVHLRVIDESGPANVDCQLREFNMSAIGTDYIYTSNATANSSSSVQGLGLSSLQGTYYGDGAYYVRCSVPGKTIGGTCSDSSGGCSAIVAYDFKLL